MACSAPPAASTDAVLVQSIEMPADTPQVKGHDFDKGREFDAVMDSMYTTGYQATSFGQSINEVNRCAFFHKPTHFLPFIPHPWPMKIIPNPTHTLTSAVTI